MLHLRLLVIMIAFLSSTSCYGLGDGVLRIKGIVTDKDGAFLANCSLELHLAEDGRLLYRKDISGEFAVSFIIAPKPHEYFMIIRCSDIDRSYTTGVYRIGGADFYKNPLNVGKIVL